MNENSVFTLDTITGIIEARSIDFAKEIKSIMIDSGITYIDALVCYAEKNNLEIETLGEIIKATPVILSSVEQEAEELNFIPKTARLVMASEI